MQLVLQYRKWVQIFQAVPASYLVLRLEYNQILKSNESVHHNQCKQLLQFTQSVNQDNLQRNDSIIINKFLKEATD